MKGKCMSCKRKVQGVKKPINFAGLFVAYLLIVLTFGISIIWWIVRRTADPADKCPMCGLTIKE